MVSGVDGAASPQSNDSRDVASTGFRHEAPDKKRTTERVLKGEEPRPVYSLLPMRWSNRSANVRRRHFASFAVLQRDVGNWGKSRHPARAPKSTLMTQSGRRCFGDGPVFMRQFTTALATPPCRMPKGLDYRPRDRAPRAQEGRYFETHI
jgi:hypothetical protein